MSDLLQPIDGPYFLTAYFWASTFLVLVLAGYTAYTMDKKRP